MRVGLSSTEDRRSEAERALQRRVWGLVRRRFAALERDVGLSQAALARRLSVRRGQVSVWLGDPDRMTLKAAARLLQAMDAELSCELRTADGGGA